jgi:hypothetical protein
VNREQRRTQGAMLRRMLQSNPFWIDHLRRYPQVSLDAPELPGREYHTITHHVYGCASYRGGGEIDEAACDCDAVTTKHLGRMDS